MRRRGRRRTARLAALLAAVVAGDLGLTTVQVVRAAGTHEDTATGAIVVLGAAQYDGRPSPDLAARLSHALDLWHRRVAPTLVVTGGRVPGDVHSEAGASADWLAARGVPQAAILREVHGRDTWQSLEATSAFLLDRHIRSVVLVSDPYHDARIDSMADHLGLHASVSPSTASPIRGSRAVPYFAKEVVEVAAGRVVGWRRLNDLVRWLGPTGT